MNITGATKINDLIVGNNFEVLGESIFDSNMEVIQDAIVDNSLTTNGHAHFFDLEVDTQLNIKGTTSLEDSVSITGKHSELHVDGDVTFDERLTANGDTVLQYVTADDTIVFNNKVVFNDDELQVQDLTVDSIRFT